jgi:RNA polymerase subunit RPABC4/transcription elongation factor Spt4
MYWRARSFRTPQGENVQADLLQTCKFVIAADRRRHITNKIDVPMWSPAHFKNGYRKKLNVTKLHLFVADVDDGSDYFVTCDRLKRADWLFFAHCTWSWSDRLHKFRVVLPLEQPIPAEHWHICWQMGADWFKRVTGATLDPATKDASRAYAVAAHENRQVPLPITTDGYALNLYHYCQPEIEAYEHQQAVKAELKKRQRELTNQNLNAFEKSNIQANQNTTLTDSERHAIAQRLGAVIDSGYAKKITCPQCHRQSLWFSMSGYVARCNHNNSCGYRVNIKHL